MPKFYVTYTIVTPESAKHGAFAETGFVDNRGNHCTKRPKAMPLREALRHFASGACEDSGTWFSECDGRQNYRDGSEERRDLHPPRKITNASYDRLRRLVGCIGG